MASKSQTELNAFFDAVIPNIEAVEPNLLRTNFTSNSKFNRALYELILADMLIGWDDYAFNNAADLDTFPGDSRKQVSDQKNYQISKTAP